MDQDTEDSGTLAALMIRLSKIRLPRALRLLDKVDAGEKLSNFDIQFLKRVHRDSKRSQPLINRHPEYLDLVTRALDLYTEIITKALDNEKMG